MCKQRLGSLSYYHMENARAYVENFEQETGWRPAQVGYFGGALLYRQYGLIKRMKFGREHDGGVACDFRRPTSGRRSQAY